MDAIIYIHGKGGSAAEADHYRPYFPQCEVFGFDYCAKTPWDAEKEFSSYFRELQKHYSSVITIANSIGAYYLMISGVQQMIRHAMMISPIVNMEALILELMRKANISEEALKDKKVIQTLSGEVLSWQYLSYVRDHTIQWHVPTHILSAENDMLTPPNLMQSFAKQYHARLTVMPEGEHWFHTEEQMRFLDDWLQNCVKKIFSR